MAGFRDNRVEVLLVAVSDKENDSHYHIWDNRVLPSFILDKDSEFSHIMFFNATTTDVARDD
jgi:hypothetical protein